MTNTGYKVYDPENRRVYTQSDVKFIEADEDEHKTMVKIEPEEQEKATGGDNSHRNENEEEDEPCEENKNDRYNDEEKVKRTESRRILSQRNRAPPARYTDYRAYLAEIEELYEEELTYDKVIKSG